MKILFVILIFLWMFIGFIGIMNCKKDRVHFEMIIFMIFALFIPLIAKWCGLI